MSYRSHGIFELLVVALYRPGGAGAGWVAMEDLAARVYERCVRVWSSEERQDKLELAESKSAQKISLM